MATAMIPPTMKIHANGLKIFRIRYSAFGYFDVLYAARNTAFPRAPIEYPVAAAVTTEAILLVARNPVLNVAVLVATFLTGLTGCCSAREEAAEMVAWRGRAGRKPARSMMRMVVMRVMACLSFVLASSGCLLVSSLRREVCKCSRRPCAAAVCTAENTL